MPIIDVTVVHPLDQPLPPGLAQSLANALGQGLVEPEGRVWVKLHELSSTCYAENGTIEPLAPLPVFVAVLLSRLPNTTGALQAHADQVVAAVASITGRPADRVHVEYLPSGAGRMVFGGRLVLP